MRRGNSGRYGGRSHHYGSRGGRNHGSGRSSSQDLGSYAHVLNFRPGQVTSPVSVAKWFLKAKDVIGSKCPKYGLKNIVKSDGTIGEYPIFNPPEIPDDTDDIVEMTLWKSRVTQHDIVLRELDQDKKCAAIAVWEIIGSDSRFRIEEYNEGLAEADMYDLDDPIDLLNVVSKTHFSDWRIDNSMKTATAQKSFVNIGMSVEENLVSYHRRWNVVLNAYSKCLSDDEMSAANIDMMLGGDHDRVVKFINSLDINRFATFISNFRTGHKAWPDTVLDAYNEAHIWTDNQVGGSRRGIFVNAPVVEDLKPAAGEKKCYRCGATGHLQNACHNNLSGRGRGNVRGSNGGRGRGRNAHSTDKPSGDVKSN
jgi:hypothetical protein